MKTVRDFYHESMACVRTGGGMSERCGAEARVREVFVFPQWLLNVYMDGSVREDV